MTKELKIRKSELLVFFLLLPVYRPPYLATEPFYFMNAFFVYGKIIAFVAAMLIYFKKRLRKRNWLNKKRTIEIAVYFSFFLCMFILGMINHNMAEIGSAFLPVITIILLFLSYLEDDITKMLNPLAFILYVYVMINFFTVILFPNGLYLARVNEMSTRVESNWFLGYRNPQIRILLPAVSVSFIYDIIKYKCIKFKSKLLLFCVLITILLIKSSTAIIGFSIFIMIYFLGFKWGIKIRPIWFIILNGIFFVAIIILRLQNLFAFFIIDILHKDITFTGRTVIWDQALQLIKKNPILGNGATEFPIGNYFVATHPHNFILYLMVKSGLIGFLLFAISAIICAKKVERFQEHMIAEILIMEYCAFFTMTLAESMTEAMFFWLVIVMGICVERLSQYEDEERYYDRYSYTIKSK